MFSSGAKTALRVPMTIFAFPPRMRLNSSARCPSESEECRSAISSPKYSLNFFTICGVSDISGTIISAVLPLFSTLSIRRKNTEVFPLPVTP